MTAERAIRRPRFILLLIAVTFTLLSALLAGCGGQVHSLNQQPAEMLMPSLPPPSVLARTAAYTDADRLKPGNGYLAFFLQHITYSGSRGVYSPTWDASGSPTPADLAYAIYAFDVVDYDLAPDLYLRWCTAPAAADVWVGVSDWTADAWEFHESNSSGKYSLGSMDDYINETGRFLAVVVVAGLDECLLDCLRLGPVVGGWEIEEVDPMVPSLISLVIDAGNKPHIAYNTTTPDGPDGWLSYAYFDGYSWDVDYVVDSGHYDADPDLTYWSSGNSLDLASTGIPYILFDDAKNEKMVLFSLESGSWHPTPVLGHYGLSPRMVLDSSDLPHYVYQDGGLFHAWYTGTEWLAEEVGSGLPTAQPAFTLSPGDTPYITYHNSDLDRVSLATLVESEWDFYNAPGTFTWSVRSDVACRSTGLAAFTFYHWTDEELWYMFYTKGVGWNSQIVDSDGDVGYFNSLAFDSRDYPHISYYDYDQKDLKYAHFDGLDWSVEVVEGDGFESGYSSAIAIDNYDRPCIAFAGYEPPDGLWNTLRYARRID